MERNPKFKIYIIVRILSVFIMLSGILLYLFNQKGSPKETIDIIGLAEGLIVCGFVTFYFSVLLKAIHRGIIPTGWYWPGDDIDRTKNPKTFWVFLSVAILISIFLYYISIGIIIDSFNPSSILPKR